MKYKGTENAEWGFKNPTEGWFNVVITDEVTLKTREADGSQAFYVPTKVIDGDFAGASINVWCNKSETSDFGEKKIGDIVLAAGLMKEFNDKFPGDDVTWFDAPVIIGLTKRLPGKYLKVKLEPQVSKKDGKTYGNIVGIAKAGAVETKTKKPAPTATPAEEEGEWE